MDAISPVFDIAGSQKTIQAINNTNSYLSMLTYGSLIKTKDQAGIINYPRAIKSPLGKIDKATSINGIPFVFKEVLPTMAMNFLSTFQTTSDWTNTA